MPRAAAQCSVTRFFGSRHELTKQIFTGKSCPPAHRHAASLLREGYPTLMTPPYQLTKPPLQFVPREARYSLEVSRRSPLT